MTKFYLLLSRYLTVLLIFIAAVASAQSRTVSGKVISTDDESGMPGVSISEKGTGNGVISDASGNFTISVGPNAVLVFSFVGMVTQEVAVGNQTNIPITMVSDVTQLSEVVVVGYGVQEKKDVTGSVVTLSSESFNKGVISSPQDLLLGKIAGVQVVQGSGAPGSAAQIRIRGGSSLSASNDPLIVIDGFPVDNNGISGTPNALATINPNDIESFTVLKDASATAIYGSRASNGVIIITTKKAKDSKFQLSYNGSVSLSTPTKYVDVLSGDEYRTLIQERLDAGQSGLTESALELLGDENTDWQKKIYQTAFSTDHNIAASGRITENIPYRLSYGYTFQEGILRTTNLKRNSINASINPSLFNNHLLVNANVKTSFSKHNFGNDGAVGAAVSFDPTQPVKNGNTRYGGYYTWTTSGDPDGDRIGLSGSNPVALLEQTHNTSDVNRFIGNLQLDYRLHFFPDLRFNLNLGMDRSKSDGINNVDDDAAFEYTTSTNYGKTTDYNSETSSDLLEAYFNYHKKIADHSLDVTAGYSWQYFYRESYNYARKTESVTDSSSTKSENYLISFFGRVNYSFKSKYLLTVSLRDDGSSRFAEDNRWGLFPAIAAGWNISSESFMTNVPTVSNLKLRLGYGITGQQDIGTSLSNYYPYIPTYTVNTTGAYYQLGDEYYETYRPNAYVSNIKWEETATFNIGLDFGILSNRISGTIDYYNRKTSDLLNYIQVANGTNFSNYVTTNVGNLENNGIEVTLNAKVISKPDFSWEAGINLSRNKNKVTKLFNIENETGVDLGSISGGTGNQVQNHQVGYAASSFYVFQQVYDSNGKPIEGLYVDRTGNGGSVTSSDLNRHRYHNPAPDALIGINTTLRYKMFDLALSGRLSIGNYVYNNVESNSAFYSNLYNSSGWFANVPQSIDDYGFESPQRLSDIYVENASFFRMDNISLGYNFNQLLSDKLKGKLSFTVQNAFLITDYSGLDPEVAGGIDNNLYPRPRVFMLGLSLTY